MPFTTFFALLSLSAFLWESPAEGCCKDVDGWFEGHVGQSGYCGNKFMILVGAWGFKVGVDETGLVLSYCPGNQTVSKKKNSDIDNSSANDSNANDSNVGDSDTKMFNINSEDSDSNANDSNVEVSDTKMFNINGEDSNIDDGVEASDSDVENTNPGTNDMADSETEGTDIMLGSQASSPDATDHKKHLLSLTQTYQAKDIKHIQKQPQNSPCTKGDIRIILKQMFQGASHTPKKEGAKKAHFKLSSI
ncbi:hypothetical protein BJY52DRAFT_1231013 [Lactarius psammicola]|nr:hypothetical protein BJY52DRAFT_1231013 [Lactarius psammicola]